VIYPTAQDKRTALEFLVSLPAGDYSFDAISGDLSEVIGDAAELALRAAAKGGYVAIVKTAQGQILRVDPAWVRTMVRTMPTRIRQGHTHFHNPGEPQ